MWEICRFAICGPNIYCDLRICDLLTQIYSGLTTSANLKILFFLLTNLTNTNLKCSNSNFQQIKISAKQTCS
jgi:hypothetical protein